MLYLLDTNHCFRLIGRDPRMVAAAKEHPAIRLATSVIVAGELRYGALISEHRIDNIASVEDFLGRIDQVPISTAIAQAYAQLKSALVRAYGPKDRSRRRAFHLASLGFTDNDLWIAATAIDQGAIVVSADDDYKRMAEVETLLVENWLA